MTTLKHNDRVTCTIKGIEITDARISINKNGDKFICQNEIEGNDTEDKLGYKYSWWFISDSEYNVKLAQPRTIRDVVVGEEVVHKHGYTHKVIDVFPNSVLLSSYSNHTNASSLYTFEELEQDFTLVQPEPEVEPIEELTMEQVIKELGREIKIKK